MHISTISTAVDSNPLIQQREGVGAGPTQTQKRPSKASRGNAPKLPHIMKNTTEIKKKKTGKRARLSIDLEAYPDIKKMLADALLATGLTTTDITIEALRERLPDVIVKLERERAVFLAQFLKKYPSKISGDL